MLMLIVKLLFGLLSILGVTKLAYHAQQSKSSVQAAIQKDSSDEEIHQKMWGYTHENDHQGAPAGMRHGFDAAMKNKMMEVRTCHMNCGMDHTCHEQCPKPWEKFQQKCIQMQPIMDCHMNCGRDHACHQQCPLPECPKMAKRMKDAMECHAKCGKGQHSCHRACPRHPMKDLSHKCHALNDVVSCHKECKPHDFKCHHECPKMESSWHLHSHGNGDNFHGNHHGHGLSGDFHGHHHKHRDHEELQHQKMWGYNDENHDGGRRHRFHNAMHEKMGEVKTCHTKCGADSICHKRCPKPWKFFEDKCMKEQRTKHMAHKCGLLNEVLACHGKCSPDDLKCHHECPKMRTAWHMLKHRGETEPEAEDKLPIKDDDDLGRDAMEEKMVGVKTCHMKCGTDPICHKKCPKPWKPLEEKCTKMQPIMDCNKNCGRDHSCHMKCPLPEDPEMAKKIEEARECHGKCPSHMPWCHRKCGHPVGTLNHKCQALKKVLSCHKECAKGDGKCHQACPEMTTIWDFHGHGHGGHFLGHGHGGHAHGHDHKHGHHKHDLYEKTGATSVMV